jgi:hypothetical protein
MKTISERWRRVKGRRVKGSENKYVVSDRGRVGELIEPGRIRIIEPHLDVANGARVYLKGLGRKRVPHLVLEAFDRPRPPGYVARHWDADWPEPFPSRASATAKPLPDERSAEATTWRRRRHGAGALDVRGTE